MGLGDAYDLGFFGLVCHGVLTYLSMLHY